MLLISPDHPASQYVNEDDNPTTVPPSPEARGAAIESNRPTDAPEFSFDSFMNDVTGGLSKAAGAVGGFMNDPSGVEKIQQGMKDVGGAVAGKALDIGMAQAPLTAEERQGVHDVVDPAVSSLVDQNFEQARQRMHDITSGNDQSGEAVYNILLGTMGGGKGAVEDVAPAVRRNVANMGGGVDALGREIPEGFPPPPDEPFVRSQDAPQPLKPEEVINRATTDSDFKSGLADMGITTPRDLTPENLSKIDRAMRDGTLPPQQDVLPKGMPPQSARDVWDTTQHGSPYSNEFTAPAQDWQVGNADTFEAAGTRQAQGGRTPTNPYAATPGTENLPDDTRATEGYTSASPGGKLQPTDSLAETQRPGEVESLGTMPSSQLSTSEQAQDVNFRSAASEARANQIRNAKSIRNVGTQLPAESIEDFRNKFGLKASTGEVVRKTPPPMAGGSTSMATWLRDDTTVPQKLKTQALKVSDATGKLVQPYYEAGPAVERSARDMAGSYESAGTQGSIDLLKGPDLANSTDDVLQRIDKYSYTDNPWIKVDPDTQNFLIDLQKQQAQGKPLTPRQLAGASKVVDGLDKQNYGNEITGRVLDDQGRAMSNFLSDLETSGRFAHKADIEGEFDPRTGAPPSGWVRVGGDYYADPMTAAGLKHTFNGGESVSRFIDGTWTPDDVLHLFGKEGDAWRGLTNNLLNSLSIVKETKLGGSLFHGPVTASNAWRVMTNETSPITAAKAVGQSIRYSFGGPQQFLKDNPSELDEWRRASNYITGLNFRNVGAGGYGQTFDILTEREPGPIGKAAINATGRVSDSASRLVAREWDSASRVVANGLVGAAAGYGTGWGIGGLQGLSEDERNAQARKWALIGGTASAASNLIVRKGIFQNYMPVLKYNTWKTLTNAGMDPQKAGDIVNNAVGGQNLIAMGRSPAFQQTLRVAMLAPDYDESIGARMGLGVASKDPTLRAASVKYLARMALTVAAAQGVQTAINQMSDDPAVRDKHFTWDNGPAHALQIDVTPLLEKQGQKWADANRRVGTHQTFIGIPAMGPIGSVADDFVGHGVGGIGNAITGHMGIAPAAAWAATHDRGTFGGQIVPQGTSGEQSIGPEAANLAASVEPIGASQFVEASKHGGVGQSVGTQTKLAAGAQLLGSRVSNSKAEGPAIDEADRLRKMSDGSILGGAAGWPPVFKENEKIVVPQHIAGPVAGVGKNASNVDRTITLTPEEAAWANRTMNTRTNAWLKAGQDDYTRLPDNGPELRDVEGTRQRGGIENLQPGKEITNKVQYLQWLEALSHNFIDQEIVKNRVANGTWKQGVQAAYDREQKKQTANAH